jgi:5'-nucleotidase
MKKKIKSILITNDDGFNAVGIRVLKEIAKKITDKVFVIAPKFNQSAKSRSITLNQEVKFEKKCDYEWIVDGTPTDCVIFALNHLLKDFKPDLILSGINAGCNVGDEVSYSGTVAAAWEGALRGINSIALSQFGGNEKSYTYDYAKKSAYEIIDNLFNQNFEKPMFFNVNFPLSSKTVDRNFLYTKLANQKLSDQVILNESNSSFKIGQMLTKTNIFSLSDLDAIKSNKISITPLSLDITNFDQFNCLIDL